MIYYYDTIILLCSSQVQVDRDLIRSMNELLLQLKQCFLWQSLANAFISSSLKKLQLKRKTIMIYIRLIFVSPCKVISTVVVHDCWFNSHKDVHPLCVFLMKSVSCGRGGLFSVCSLWVTLVCHCHHRLDILACCGIHAGMRRELGGPHSSGLHGPRLLLKVLISAALRKGRSENGGILTPCQWHGNALSVAATFCNRS